jgi:hypothetical protein
VALAQPSGLPGQLPRSGSSRLSTAASRLTPSCSTAPPVSGGPAASATTLTAPGRLNNSNRTVNLRLTRNRGDSVVVQVSIMGPDLIRPLTQQPLVGHVGLRQNTLISLGNFWRKRQLKNTEFSSPLGQNRSISANSSDGFC